jgi:pre-mRNA-splicing factor RBM22/SLT11
MPKDETNRDFWANNVNQQIDKIELPYKNVEVQGALAEMSKKFGPSAKRNLAKVCTFFVRGLCTRGTLCPYRHEKIDDEDLDQMKKGVNIDERIRERFYGINDPIAKKILDRVKETNLPKAPEDMNITTLFLGGIEDILAEDELKAHFITFGKIKAVKVIPKSNCAFVCFHVREAAVKALETMYDRCYINEKKVKLLWAKSQLDSAPSQKKPQG